MNPGGGGGEEERKKTEQQHQQPEQQARQWQPRPIMCFVAKEWARMAAEAEGKSVGNGGGPLDCVECGKKSRSFIHCALCGYYACEDCVLPRPEACPGCLEAAAARRQQQRPR